MVGKKPQKRHSPVCVGLCGALASKCARGCAGNVEVHSSYEGGSESPPPQLRLGTPVSTDPPQPSVCVAKPDSATIGTPVSKAHSVPGIGYVTSCLLFPRSQLVASKASSLLGGVFSDTSGIETCL